MELLSVHNDMEEKVNIQMTKGEFSVLLGALAVMENQKFLEYLDRRFSANAIDQLKEYYANNEKYKDEYFCELYLTLHNCAIKIFNSAYNAY